VTISSVLVQWGSLTAVAALIGAVVLDLAVLPQSAPEIVVARRRLGRWTMVAAVMVLLASGATLIVRASTMAGGHLDLALRALPAVLIRTHFGTIWIARLASVVAFLLVWHLPFRLARFIGRLLVLGVSLTTSLTGHAADWGSITVSVFVDWVHVVSGAVWVGGLFGLAAVVMPSASAWPRQITGKVAGHFSRLAGACLILVVLTGISNAWMEVPFVSALWTTSYGRVLLAKIGVVVAIIWIGALNRFTIVPGLTDGQGRGFGYGIFRLARYVSGRQGKVAAATLPRRFVSYVTREAILGIVVFASTAVLTDSTPARHTAHLTHSGSAKRGPYRVTMGELHKSGGIPPGWIFRPPEGDPGRGREVFVKLECFACHTVQGESFPPPSRPGPDLTGMGGHHPAGYLAESVINPNAVIVEGPGYTGPDGSSIMPDYRDSLTLAELDDLVAYLKALD